MPISSPTDIAGCVVWLAADREAYADGDPVTNADNGGSGVDWTSLGGPTATYKTSITPTGKPVFRFSTANNALYGPDLSAMTAASVFVVVKIVNDPPDSAAHAGLWLLTTDTNATYFPYIDSTIYDACFTSARKTTVDPTPSLSSAFRVYEVLSGSGDWRSYLDGVNLFTTGTNTVACYTIPALGYTSGVNYLQGDIAAFLIYDSVLSAGNRADVETYLTQRYITGTGAAPSSFQVTAFQPNAFQEGSFFNPQSVVPGTLALALTPFTPTVVATANQSVTPGTLSLVLTPFTPTVLAYHNQSGFQTAFQTDAFQVGWQFSFKSAVPGTLALTLTPFTPTVAATANKFVTPGTLALTLTPFVPTVVATANKFVVPGTLALTLTTFAPTVAATGGRVGKNYGSGAEVMPQAPFKWSKAWEQKFAEDRMLAERAKAKARFEDFDAFVLEAWRTQEDDDLVLSATSFPW
jgi:hypothetical protein